MNRKIYIVQVLYAPFPEENNFQKTLDGKSEKKRLNVQTKHNLWINLEIADTLKISMCSSE